MPTSAAGTEDRRSALRGGIVGIREVSRPAKHAAACRTDPIISEKDAMTVEVALEWNDSYHENDAVLYQQHPAARRRHPSGWFSRGADPHVNNYADESGIAKKEKVSLTGDDAREGLTCDAVGQGAGSEVFLARPRTSWCRPKSARGRKPSADGLHHGSRRHPATPVDRRKGRRSRRRT